jgi:uncharacterized membrane protein YfcA
MLWESLGVMRGRKRAGSSTLSKGVRTIAHVLPSRLRFPRSGLYISVIPPLALGAVIGTLASLMGVGGGFILVPAMIYLLRMPTNVVVGTSLFQVMVVSTLIVFLQANITHTVDIVLAAMLMIGGVVGAQFGARLGARMRAEQLRAVLGLILVATSIKFALDLVLTPDELFVFAGR